DCGANISPLRAITVVLGIVLATSVMVLFCNPDFPSELKTTSISPLSPGLIGSFGQRGTVHPQLPCAEEIIKLLLPTFLNLKIVFTDSPWVICPKSFTSSSNSKKGKLSLSIAEESAAVIGLLIKSEVIWLSSSVPQASNKVLAAKAKNKRFIFLIF